MAHRARWGSKIGVVLLTVGGFCGFYGFGGLGESVAAHGSISSIVSLPSITSPRATITRYPAGQLREQRYYLGDKRVGVHTGWWPNGSLRFRYHYANDEMDGVAEEWLPSGLPYRRMEYSAGHESGMQTIWKRDGSLKAHYLARDGRRYGLSGTRDCINVNEDVPLDE